MNRLFFNGVDATTGNYELPPMTETELATRLSGEADEESLSELQQRNRAKKQSHYGVRAGVDPQNLAETGWGIIFAPGTAPAMIEALDPLLALRREQAGERFRVYQGESGPQPGERKGQFLARHGVGPGPADPDKVPYYLLIVGSPEALPFIWQYQLDVQYAVGRIDFETPEACHRYALAVVAAERGACALARKLAIFGVANEDDPATQLSQRELALPLSEKLRTRHAAWQVENYLGERTTHKHLAELMGGSKTPALLFTASHGVGYPMGHPHQRAHQGALLCGDWPGPFAWQGAIPEDFFFSGEHLSGDASLHGLITFSFACYGAGVPRWDTFPGQPKSLAEQAFTSTLPRSLLSHPRGGALAFIGHVDRAWGYSFHWPGSAGQTAIFEDTLSEIMAGKTVGSALEYFNERYAELATMLTHELEEIEFGKKGDSAQLSGLWTAHNDARGYAIIGDPAVRLPLAGEGESIKRNGLNPPQTKQSSQPIKGTHVEEPEMIENQEPAELDYGLRDIGQNLGSSLKGLVGKLSEALSVAVRDLSDLEVRSYTTNEQAGSLDETQLRAKTRITLSGDMDNIFPLKETEEGTVVDKELWELHRQMVQLAQENRTEFFKIMGQLVTTLLKGK